MNRKTIIIPALAGLMFFLGFAIVETERPPYSLLYSSYDSFRNNALVDAVYDRIRHPFGVQPAHESESPQDDDLNPFHEHWVPARDRLHVQSGSEEQREAREKFGALAYLSSYEVAPPLSGVVEHQVNRAAPGINFYVTGGGPNAFLIDMDGTLLHKWSIPFSEALPDFDGFLRVGAKYWRYAHLFEDGSVVAIFPRHGVVKLDKESRLVWATQGDYHHVFDVAEDGSIVVNGREIVNRPDWDSEMVSYEEFVCYLNGETGEEVRRFSLFAALDSSVYAPLREHTSETTGDHMHANTIEILDGRFASRHPAFRKGNVLTSLRHLDAIGIVDPRTQKFVWALTGLWDMQHRPTFVRDGSIMVFNNNNEERQAQVLTIDPLTQEVLWSYENESFMTNCCGVAWPLANSNVLITESQAGRVFEVTREGEIVWDFYNPERQGENDVAIATVFELFRYPLDYADAWLD